MTSTTGFPTAAVAKDATLPSLSSKKDGGSLQTNKENCENRKEGVEYENFQKLVESWSHHPENFEEDIKEHGSKNEEEEEKDLSNAAAEFFDRLPATTQKRLFRAIEDYEDSSTRLIKAEDSLERDRQAHLRPDGGQPHQTGKDLHPLVPYSLWTWFKTQVRYKKHSKKAHQALDTITFLHVSAASRLTVGVDFDDVEGCVLETLPEDFRHKIETFLEQGGILKRPASSIFYESRWGT